VPPGSNFLLDHGQELPFGEPSLAQAVDETGEARDRRRRHEPAGHEDAARLTQGRDAIVSLGQVVERPQQEDRVERAVVELQRECIPA
jgi:hypothetical protein